ncbi:hypothetical protein FOZ62_007588, partial [Perkinsus olseni]
PSTTQQVRRTSKPCVEEARSRYIRQPDGQLLHIAWEQVQIYRAWRPFLTLLTVPQQPAQNRECSGSEAESTNAGRESMGGPSRPEQRKSHMWSVDDGTGDLAIPDTINPKRRPSLIAPGKDPVAEVKEDILEWTYCHLDAVDVDARRKAFRQLQALWHPDKFDDDPSKAAVTVVFQYLQSLKQMFTSDKE